MTHRDIPLAPAQPDGAWTAPGLRTASEPTSDSATAELPDRLETGVSGFDQLTFGGLPRYRTTLVTGPAGSGKTVFTAQFLAEGIKRGEPGIFVTFEEPAVDLRRNLSSFGWSIERFEAEQMWRFLDASPLADQADLGNDLDLLAARVGQEVDAITAQRIVLDSTSALFQDSTNPGPLRQTLRRFVYGLRRMQLSVLMTLEVPAGATALAPLGFEDFLADNVILLRNTLEEEKRRRTIEILKMRGAAHRRGEFPFNVIDGEGVVVMPLSAMQLTQRSTTTRIPSGNRRLDELCDGGFFRDSVVLVSGATGTGKTLTGTEFLAAGGKQGERCLLFAFEESHDQILRNAAGWGCDFDAQERAGLLRVAATYPEIASLEDHLVEMMRHIEQYQPQRIAIDSLSALERSGTAKGFREFMIVLTSYIKAKQIAALFTATAPSLLGGESATDGHISTLTDSIILLRYAEVAGDIQRGLAVLKMRGSHHDTRIHRFHIDSNGMRIGEPFRGVSGILSGTPRSIVSDASDSGTEQ